MTKKIITIIIFILISFSTFAANYDLSNFDIDDIKGKLGSGKGGSVSDKIKDSTEPPTSRFIDQSSKSLSKEDERHITLHMKLANRHFSKKDYEKAKEEVAKVLGRDSSHSGGHFMLAVIAGRLKDYKTAWYHINIAQGNSNNQAKVNDFIKKLKTVSSEPQNNEWIDGIFNGIEKDASDRTFDLIEKLLSEYCSTNITSISTTDYNNLAENKSWLEVTFRARDSFESNKIFDVLSKNNRAGASINKKSDNELITKITYELKADNPEVKPIKGINEFITDLLEQSPEIAISNTDEDNPRGGTQEIVYDIATRDFSSLNKFMRNISPFALRYILQEMELEYVPGTKNTMWKAKIKVIYKM